VSKATFDYLRAFACHRVFGWLRRRSWMWLRRRYLPGRWPTNGRVTLSNPASVAVTRYRYRGTRIPSPWSSGLE
jgi:RNA-directed DNA polymerase